MSMSATVVAAAVLAAAAVVAVVAVATHWLYSTAIVMASARADLHLLSNDPPRPGGEERRAAVIVGGSIAGLAAARVLLRYFDEVTVVESEALAAPDVTGNGDGAAASQATYATPVRRNVAQYGSNHLVLPLAVRLLEALFPGFTDDCEAAGGRRSLLAHNFAVTSFGVALAPLPSRAEADQLAPGLETIVCSRGLIEGVLRYRLFRDSGMLAGGGGGGTDCRLRYRPGTAATALVFQDGKVHGVEVFDKASKASEFIYADAVVDASGRASWGLKWINALGVEPDISSYDPEIVYASYSFADLTAPDEPIHVASTLNYWPVNPHRNFIAQRIEGGRILATVSSTSPKDMIPASKVDFLDFVESTQPRLATSLASKPALGNMVLGQMLGSTKPLHVGTSKWIHYESIPIPAGFFAVGDSMMCLNPTYGQGIMMACQAVSSLDRALRSTKSVAEATSMYFKLQAARSVLQWHMPLSTDLLNPDIESRDAHANGWLLSFFRWLGERGTWAASRSKTGTIRVMRVGSW
ncbi:hypothetical protein HK405_013638, partial [Cladochytrium tenue]